MRAFSMSLVPMAVLLSVASAIGQSSTADQHLPAQQPPVTFKANIELVLVPTVVTDKSGQHVSGLKAEDFSLLQDKNKAPHIAFCQEITHTSQGAPQPTNSVPGVFTNVASNTQHPKNLVVIAVDLINTPFNDQVYARKGIIKYLSESIAPDSLVALLFMTPGGVRMLHDFTTDSATLIAALQRVSKGNGKAGGDLAFPKATSVATIDNEANQLAKFELSGYTADLSKQMMKQGTAQQIDFLHRNAMQDTTSALTQIANIYSGVPGRKALIWVTSGLPRSVELALQQFTGNVKTHETDVSDDFEHAWKSLNDASFAVYSVDAGGLFSGKAYSGAITPGGSVWGGGSGATHSGSTYTSTSNLIHQETSNTLLTLSNMTGGRAYLNTNDLAKGIHSAINDSENYYLLGFYVETEGIKPGWHPLKVALDRKGISVRSREGFIVSRTPVSSAERASADLKLALRSPVQFSGLPLMLRWQQANQLAPASSESKPAPQTPASQTNAKKRIAFDLVLPSNAIQINEADSRAIQLEILGIAQNAAGDNMAGIRQAINHKASPEEAANLRQNGLLYKGTFELAPGTYTVHLAVRDDLSGKLGSIIAPLKVE